MGWLALNSIWETFITETGDDTSTFGWPRPTDLLTLLLVEGYFYSVDNENAWK